MSCDCSGRSNNTKIQIQDGAASIGVAMLGLVDG
jgi:hypothetical protein